MHGAMDIHSGQLPQGIFLTSREKSHPKKVIKNPVFVSSQKIPPGHFAKYFSVKN